jgi:hypothetical protein
MKAATLHKSDFVQQNATNTKTNTRLNKRQASTTIGVDISNICYTYNNGVFLMTILHIQPAFSQRMKITLVGRK